MEVIFLYFCWELALLIILMLVCYSILVRKIVKFLYIRFISSKIIFNVSYLFEDVYVKVFYINR